MLSFVKNSFIRTISQKFHITSRRMRRFFFVSHHPVLRHKEKMCRSAHHPVVGAQAEPVLRRSASRLVMRSQAEFKKFLRPSLLIIADKPMKTVSMCNNIRALKSLTSTVIANLNYYFITNVRHKSTQI